MQKIAVVGAGRIGVTIANLLAHSGDYRVQVLDPNAQALAALPQHPAIVPALLAPDGDVRPLLEGAFALLGAVPFHQMARLAQAAVAVGAHYLDLTEDVASTQAIQALAADARTALIPQCGLAPGFVSIAAAHLCQGFDSLDTVHLRVGALPRFPDNALGYQLSWSTEGVINEYCQPCEAIAEGRLQTVPALQGLEQLRVLGQDYEAFNTSGGLGSLAHSLQGRVRELNYKTLRYPGHARLMRFLLDELRLRDDRALLRQVLEGALPATEQDVVVVFISVSGRQGGRLLQRNYAQEIFGTTLHGRRISAIQNSTASSICAVLDLLAQGQLPNAGLVRQEAVALPAFLANRFGAVYANSACV
ncbi:MAG: saccharopine dehydrogenase NADP-binding domain-containing protein [Comamonas sp.]|nr:saccharopine dehydrogenase NADP-binding domain-containing protein [Comamonas sp.]